MGVGRISLVNFTGFRGNWGCQATSWELVRVLNRAWGGRLPHVDLIPLLPRCEIDARLGVETPALLSAMAAVAEGPSPRDAAFLLARCRERFGPWVERVRAADLVVFQAEGTMAGTDFVRGVRLLLLPFVARHIWGKPVWALNQTLFSADDAFTAALRPAMRDFDVVAVRETASLAFARSIGLDAGLIPDAAFLARPDTGSEDTPEAPRTAFAVTGSAFANPGNHEAIFAAVEELARSTGLKPIIVAPSDPALLRLAEERWQPCSYEVVPPRSGYRAGGAALARAAFLVGGRYHMAILAATVGTPSILLNGDTWKNEGLAGMLGWPEAVRAASDLAGILADADEILTRGPALRRSIAGSVLHARLRIARATRWLGRRLASPIAPPPEEFRTPMGRLPDLSTSLPYAEQARAKAAGMAYRPDEAPFGAMPGGGALQHLADAARAGDAEAATMVRQVAESEPDWFARYARKAGAEALVAPSVPMPAARRA